MNMWVETVPSLAELLRLSLSWILRGFFMSLLHYNLKGAVTSIPNRQFFLCAGLFEGKIVWQKGEDTMVEDQWKEK